MFGLQFKAICPYCGKEHFVDLGACTHYYKVNDSEFDYTKYKCCECKKEYWLSHVSTNVRDIKIINENDKLKSTSIVFW